MNTRSVYPVMLMLLLAIPVVAPGQERSLVRVNVESADAEAVEALLQSGPDIANHGPIDGEVDMVMDAEARKLLAKLGLSYEVIEADLDAREAELRSAGYLEHFHSYYRAKAAMLEAVNAYPHLAKMVDIGNGWEKESGLGDRDVLAVKISDNVDDEEADEPEVLIMGCHHAREIITPEIILHYMNYLLSRYGTDPYVTYLVDNRQIWLVPIVNPDGHWYVFQQDLWWRKNRRQNSNGSRGVDLNRNYSFKWGYDNAGSSPNPSSGTYRGTGPFSEPETQAIRDLAEAHDFKVALSYHSYSQLWLFPWGYISGDTPDHPSFVAIADSCVAYNGYRPGNPKSGAIYITNGDTDDWMYGEQTTKAKVYSFTPEVGTAFHPDTTEIMPLILENLGANLYITYVAGELPEINHEPLTDSDDFENDFLVTCTIRPAIPLTGPTTLNQDSLWLFHAAGAEAAFDSVQLTPTGAPEEYQALLPNPGQAGTIRYYVEASDEGGRTGRAPKLGGEFSFNLGLDTEFPSLVHTPVGDQYVGVDAFVFSAQSEDNSGVNRVFVEIQRNGGEPDTLALEKDPEVAPALYQGVYPANDLAVGDEFSYRIVAEDVSVFSNRTQHPESGRHHFSIIERMAFDFETSDNGFVPATGGEWDWGRPTVGPEEAASGLKVWGTRVAGHYGDRADALLLSPEIDLTGAASPALIFSQWYQIEYSQDIFWDAGNVKIYPDGGPGTVIEPQDGYDGICNNSDIPLDGEGVFGGPASNGNYWHDVVFDLSAYRDQIVRVGFHFASDGAVTAPGWYIDNVRVHMDAASQTLFSNTTLLENTDDAQGPYQVSSTIASLGDITRATLWYKLSTDAQFTSADMANEGGSRYAASIPGQPLGSEVEYYVEALSRFGQFTTDPAGAPAEFFSFQITDQAPVVDASAAGLPAALEQGAMAEGGLAVANLGLLNLTYRVADSLLAGPTPQVRTAPALASAKRPLPSVHGRAGDGIARKLAKPWRAVADLTPIIFDAAGDVAGDGPDIQAVHAAVDSSGLTLAVEFVDALAEGQGAAIVSLDTDQFTGTGAYPAAFGRNLAGQDVGAEVEVFFDIANVYGFPLPVAMITGSRGGDAIRGFAQIESQENRIFTASFPSHVVDLLGWNVNATALALADTSGASMDWAPDEGHGFLGADRALTWLKVWPRQGTVRGGQADTLAVAIDGRRLVVGAHSLGFYVQSNDPAMPELEVLHEFQVMPYTGVDEGHGRLVDVPATLHLAQSNPNPYLLGANPAGAAITLDLPEAGHASLTIYNLLGQHIRTIADGHLPAGRHTLRWDGRDDLGQNVVPGVYLYRLTTGRQTLVRKLLLLR